MSKVAVVTGAGSGIGRSIALRLAAEGRDCWSGRSRRACSDSRGDPAYGRHRAGVPCGHRSSRSVRADHRRGRGRPWAGGCSLQRGRCGGGPGARCLHRQQVGRCEPDQVNRRRLRRSGHQGIRASGPNAICPGTVKPSGSARSSPRRPTWRRPEPPCQHVSWTVGWAARRRSPRVLRSSFTTEAVS